MTTINLQQLKQRQEVSQQQPPVVSGGGEVLSLKDLKERNNKDGVLKRLAKGIISPVATIAARPFQAVAELAGASSTSVDEFSSKISGGLIAPVPHTVKDLAKDVGRGIETVSLGLGGGAVKQGVQSGIRQGVGAAVKQGAKEGAKAGSFGGFGAGLSEKGEVKDAIKGAAVGTAVGAGLGVVAPVAIGGIKKGFGAVKESAEQVVTKAKPIGEGVEAIAREFGTRAKRLGERTKGAFTEISERSKLIKESTPKVRSLIKNNVDPDIIDFATKADKVTKKGLKEIVDIARKSKGLGIQERPGIVAGRAAGSQYSLINKQKKNIGKKIGEAVSKLSKTERVDMGESFGKLKSQLQAEGVTFKGGRLTNSSFNGTNFTPQQRSKITELWKLSTEKVRNVTPKDLWKKDNLFSKLQREARFEGVSDILIELPDGSKKNLFNVFRDVFRDTLDNVSPDGIRGLNKQYREYSLFVDDIENSIVKSGKFETGKGVDVSNFAQTNLRRIMSDAQSAGDFLAIARKMDVQARKLGFQGARPEDLISFSERMKDIYPKSTPPTGFRGGIGRGVVDAVGTISEAGKANLGDKQKAIEEFFDLVSKKTTKKI